MKKGYNLLVLNALKYFIINPYSKIHLRGFSRIMKISPNSANRFLNLFLKEGLVIEERVANLRYFKANLNSISFREIKKTFSVFELEKSGLIEALKEVCFSCMLFGSVARGGNDKNSDIDLVIVTKEKEKVRRIIRRFQKKFKQELSCHIFTSLEWKEGKTENKAFYQDVVSCGMNLIGEVLI